MCNYDLLFDGKKVGQVLTEEIGLYTEFRCKGKLPKNCVFRIKAAYENGSINLGICVPEKDGFTCFARVATKNLLGKNPVFRLVDAASEEKAPNFIPIDCQLPFSQIGKLPGARLEITDGCIGVII